MASIESNEQNNNASNRYQDINSFMYKNSSRLLNWYLPALREAFYNNLKTMIMTARFYYDLYTLNGVH